MNYCERRWIFIFGEQPIRPSESTCFKKWRFVKCECCLCAYVASAWHVLWIIMWKKPGDKSPWMLSHIILTSDYNAWWRQQQVSFLKYSVLVYPGQPFIPVPKGVQHGCSYQQATEMECQFEHWHVTTDVTTNFTILCVLNLYFTLFVFTFQSFSTSYRLLFF